MGWETVAWCEWNEFGQKVLKYHFPNAIGHGDITKTDFTPYANKIDILTGGFPCQPYSMAGKRKGKEDERHLWPEMRRAIREIAPRYIVGENVLGLVNWNGGLVFDEVCADLEAEGYEVAPVVIPAAAVNAPHGRDRVWFVAHNNSTRLQKERTEQQTTRIEQYGKLDGPTPDTEHLRCEQCQQQGQSRCKQGLSKGICDNGPTTDTDNARQQTFNNQKPKLATENRAKTFSGNGFESIYPGTRWENFPTESPVCGGNDGVPGQLDGITFSKWRAESIKAYGNAIVPQVAFEIFKAIKLYEKGL
jgi:DNA (cytosine-5)-methyltransferase 1